MVRPSVLVTDPQEPTPEEAVQLAEAEGLSLITSNNASGYMNVWPRGGGDKDGFYAVVSRLGVQVVLGRFRSREAAALCFARSKEGRAAAENLKGGRNKFDNKGGNKRTSRAAAILPSPIAIPHECPVCFEKLDEAGADPVASACNHVFCRACIESVQSDTATCPLCRATLIEGGLSPASTVATEAEGLRLHLSSRGATGYKGVSKHKGRFRAIHEVDGRRVSLGCFATAVEAAVAYARPVQQQRCSAPAAASVGGAALQRGFLRRGWRRPGRVGVPVGWAIEEWRIQQDAVLRRPPRRNREEAHVGPSKVLVVGGTVAESAQDNGRLPQFSARAQARLGLEDTGRVRGEFVAAHSLLALRGGDQ
ncbi:hypothetical protein EMIHUDRAFT_211503 [Emiliania huxleyi CCMP1516]|uniref:RING-type domain-containing protein n=2 Tax=Emiliania huxleyi TaxID=2903 RepID=A0A0D3IVQ8_EMIH1|nr:hypothetical protein EMIHUDRAFT_211503 [Emiliania huxleyi CCMP1516]EOD15343.1 hypothetical protein EMIHUDRAFT_211503 [Emiliania huxleyi CCMP1516]|eukprot:XP_005767772.1 hypothetical protein EMIHUDRAFT_211503 [Emiliania huxleyi CCMP1516]